MTMTRLESNVRVFLHIRQMLTSCTPPDVALLACDPKSAKLDGLVFSPRIVAQVNRITDGCYPISSLLSVQLTLGMEITKPGIMLAYVSAYGFPTRSHHVGAVVLAKPRLTAYSIGLHALVLGRRKCAVWKTILCKRCPVGKEKTRVY